MMRFIKNHMASMEGIATWPLISLLIFFVFFVLLFVYVMRMRKGYIDEVASQPLNDSKVPKSALLLLLLASTSIGVAQDTAVEVVQAPFGTHFGLSDDVWLVMLGSTALLLTAMIVGAMSILKNLIEHLAQVKARIQAEQAAVVGALFALTDSAFWGLVTANAFLMGFLLLIMRNIRLVSKELKPKPAPAPAKAAAAPEAARAKAPSVWARIWQSLNAHASIEKERDILLDHAYDGIQELDNRLPPWWLYGFYVSIVAGVIYLFNFHIFGYSPLMDEAYEIEMAEAQAATEAYLASLALNVDERTVEYVLEDSRLSSGAGLFNKHCKACHAADGGGGVGPNLTDDYWLHGGQISDLFTTIKYGIPAKGMKSWKADLTPTEIQNVATYILSLNGTTPAAPKDAQGEFEEPAQPAGTAEDATASL